MKLFTIGFYYLNDYSEKCYYYSVYAYSEKQARLFLGQHLNASFANSLKQAYVMKYKTNDHIAVLVHISFEELQNNHRHDAGKICYLS